MSMFSEIDAEIHNKELDKWKEKFRKCKDFDEFQVVLEEFEKFSHDW